MKNTFIKKIRKIFPILFIMLMLSAETFSAPKLSPSRAAFHKGSTSLGFGAGVGVGYTYYGDITTLPAFFISFDHGIINNAGPGNIGIGGILAMKTSISRYPSGNYRAVWRNYIAGVRGTWHLTALANVNNKFDPYAGVTVGFRVTSYDDTYYNANPGIANPYSYSSVYPMAGAFIGAKYNFARVLGVFAEAGYDISFLRLGLCLNF